LCPDGRPGCRALITPASQAGLAALNKAIRGLEADGELNRLLAKYR
jgi:ABC-type amino acid transport substrate-binding protein